MTWEDVRAEKVDADIRAWRKIQEVRKARALAKKIRRNQMLIDTFAALVTVAGFYILIVALIGFAPIV